MLLCVVATVLVIIRLGEAAAAAAATTFEAKSSDRVKTELISHDGSDRILELVMMKRRKTGSDMCESHGQVKRAFATKSKT
jgi:hypothetical protein